MEWTGARYADGPTAEVSIHIAAPPERVWEIVADPLAMPELSDELQGVEWIEPGVSFAGRNAHPAIGEWTTTSYVIESERPHRFAWAVSDRDTPSATWRFTLEPQEDGGTKLTEWMQIGPGPSGLTPAIEAMPDKEEKIIFVRLREHETHMTRTLADIKARCE